MISLPVARSLEGLRLVFFTFARDLEGLSLIFNSFQVTLRQEPSIVMLRVTETLVICCKTLKAFNVMLPPVARHFEATSVAETLTL